MKTIPLFRIALYLGVLVIFNKSFQLQNPTGCIPLWFNQHIDFFF